MNRLLASGLVALVLSTGLLATSQTLPKGVFQAGIDYRTFDIAQVGGEKLDQTTAKGDDNYRFVDIDNYTGEYIPGIIELNQNIQQINTAAGSTVISEIDTDIQLANFARRTATTFKLAYGITNKLTASFSIPYIVKTVEYNSEYRASAQPANDSAQTVANGGGTLSGSAQQIADRLNVVPATATGEGFGDARIGLKYRFANTMAAAIQCQGGFLAYYIHSTPGRFTFFDQNNIKLDQGDVFVLKIASTIPMYQKWALKPDILFYASQHDRQKYNNWQIRTIS